MKHHTPAMVAAAMGLMLVRVKRHERGCQALPLDIGPFELKTERRATDER